jgi:hypothetical protein
MLVDIMPELAAAGGLFLGCLARAILPFLRKKYQAAEAGESVKWEGRYIWTLIFALFVSFVVTTLLLPAFEIPPSNVFPLAFAMGWSAQDITNMMVK